MDLNPMDELKIVQDIITVQEGLSFKVFSWAAGFVTAFTIGLFHNSVDFPPWIYIVCSLIIILGFFVVARHHWSTFASACVRSTQIEKEIKKGSYSYVKINKVLLEQDKISMFGGYKLWLPYLTLCFIVIIAGVAKGL